MVFGGRYYMKTNIKLLRYKLYEKYPTGKVQFLEILDRPESQIEIYFRVKNHKTFKIIFGYSVLKKASTKTILETIYERIYNEI